MSECCKNCRYFSAQAPLSKGEAALGTCHKGARHETTADDWCGDFDDVNDDEGEDEDE